MKKKRIARAFDYLEAKQKKLADFATRKGLRLDWHEPDEQDITAVVEGREFDNAYGDAGRTKDSDPYWEQIVILRDEGTGEEMQINLATLFAIATYKLRAPYGETSD